jgi:hypothetical protein
LTAELFLEERGPQQNAAEGDVTFATAAGGSTIMKTVAGFCVILGLLAATPVSASDIKPFDAAKISAAQMSSANITEFSAVRRKHRVVATAPALIAPAHPVWTGPDPTKGPGIEQLREMQREGRCVIDEGYGRYTSCTNQ